MGELLIHSLAEFDDLILGALDLAGAKRVVEIGSESGRMTERLLAYVSHVGGELIAIDPSPSAEAARRLDLHPRATLVRAPSLEVLREHPADAYLVDGDHNYYTVLHESAAMWDAARGDGRPLLAFYHDVGWPWARRDLYYDPGRIPAEYLKPHTWEHGVTLDDPGVVEGGFRGEGGWACALREGGPRNGVLTAIEDFVVGKEAGLAWAHLPAVFGLGVLFDRNAPFAAALTTWLEPFHQNPLLERLERNRLECYLRVIALQDQQHAVRS
jgi:SAM-dependent methyltransferase